MITKIGKCGGYAALAVALFAALSSGRARAADTAVFSAQVDRNQISMDDSVSLKLTVKAEGSPSIGKPSYSAPDFTAVNQFDNTFVESYYDSTSGRFGMKNTQQLTVVLRPNKTGSLKISHLQIQIDGKTQTAPDISVEVGNGGGGTPPPPNYGGGGVGLRGASKHVRGSGIFVRAELSKDKVYKGEQVIVRYYLYRRVRVMNLSIDKFPVLSGFLSDEPDMPVLQRLDNETVVLDGVAYQRSLLAQYTAYPLQEGKLKIDTMAVKYTYFADPGLQDDGEDPFMNFFQQLTPRQGDTHSEPLTVEVEPLPAAGRPSSFSGGVGDFTVTSAIDKTEAHVNEAITLTVKIEGRGNLSAIGEPKVAWPNSVELYDSKGTAHAGRGGVGDKVFEILLIPRTAGPLVLPPMDFSFFDPAKKQYVTRSTEPVKIDVQPALPGSQAPSNPVVNNAASDNTNAVSSDASKALRPLKFGESESSISGISGIKDHRLPFALWHILYWLAAAALLVFVTLIGIDLTRKAYNRNQEGRQARARAQARSWEKLQALSVDAMHGADWQQVAKGYEILHTMTIEALDRSFGIGARSLPRAEMRRLLVEERGLDPVRWEKVERLLEYTEVLRFAGSAGREFQQQARIDFGQWVREAEGILKSFD
jgi:hypothetical protein